MENEISIAIVDDHQLLIDGLKCGIHKVENINVIIEAHNGLELLKKLEVSRPKVILLDIMMPKMDGLECAKIIIDKYPHIKIIVLSQFSETRFIKKFRKIGVSGYLLKNVSNNDLIYAIHQVILGKTFFFEEYSNDWW